MTGGVRERDIERERWSKVAGNENPDCACWVIISLIRNKRRGIIKDLSLCHCNFVPLTGNDTPCRLSLISSTSLNQYGPDHDKTMACASCRLGDRDKGSNRERGWAMTQKTWEENDVEWHLCRRCGDWKGRTSYPDKNLLLWWFESELVYWHCVLVDE